MHWVIKAWHLRGAVTLVAFFDFPIKSRNVVYIITRV